MSISIFNDAKSKAIEFGHEYITPEHVFAALLNKEEIQKMISSFDIEPQQIQDELEEYLKEASVQNIIPALQSDGHLKVTRAVDRLQRFEILISTITNGQLDDNFYLFSAMFTDNDSFVYYLLSKFGVEKAQVETYVKRYYAVKFFDHDEKTGAPATKGKKEDTPSELEKYAVNLNEKAKELKIDPLIGRESEVYSITQIMARYKKNNAMLIGEAGVGKTAIVEGLALNIVNGNVPESLRDATIYALDIASLLAGTRFRGEFEERVKLVLEELKLDPNAILFIDEIHMILSAGASGDNNVNAANLLKPALARGDLRCIGSTTYEEYRKFVEKDKALARRFKKLDVNEPTVEDAKAILKGSKSYYETFHGLYFDDEALDAAVDLSHRYVKGFLPDKAFDLIDDAAAHIKLSGNLRNLNVDDIEAEVSKTARIPPATVSESENQKLENLEGDLLGEIFGQDAAITELTDSIIISRSGLREPNKPAAAYLFAGPTGVGKTEVAKQLARTLGIELVRMDMSEYMEKHSVSKLIGAGPGYVGYGEGGNGSGKLINAIDTTPHCVLLIDEIEKAHADVQNIFLQVMDNASLESSSGKKVDFQNVIIIMTTNAGSAISEKSSIGFGNSTNTDNSGEQDKAIKAMFSPEFRNRLDAIIRFSALDERNMVSIANKFVGEMISQAKVSKGVTITVADEVVSFLAVKGYDRAYGARPMKRAITDYIKKPLARLLLKAKAGDHLRIELNEVPVVKIIEQIEA
jgi:ATP-dependent Clp protease ATP-binding subunit ClpA